MKNSVVGIYTYRGDQTDLSMNGYYFLYLFNDSGLIEQTPVVDLYEEIFTASKCPIDAVGPFETIESLNQFAYKICDEFKYLRISLHSTVEYNSLIESSSGLHDLKKSLLESGNILENIDQQQKKSFIGRIFS